METKNIRLELPFNLSCKDSAGCSTKISMTAIVTVADGMTLEQLVERAARPMVINWQNSNRPDNEADLLKLAGQAVEILIKPVNQRDTSVSTSKAIDKVVETAKAGKLSETDRLALEELLAKLKA